MREIRSSGSVEGVVRNGHSYSDSPLNLRPRRQRLDPVPVKEP